MAPHREPDPQADVAPLPRKHTLAAIAALIISAACLLTADLALKWWAFNALPGRPVEISEVLANRAQLPDIERTIAPRVLSLRLVLNRGAVFGLGQGQKWLFILVTVGAITAIIWAFANSHRHHRLLHTSLVFILAGALGNMYDRIVFSAVRDMLHLFPGVNLPFGWTWPSGRPELYPWIFNLADVFLLVGIGLMLLRALLFSGHEDKPVDTAN